MKKLLFTILFSFLAISIFGQHHSWKNPERRKVDFRDSTYFHVAPTLATGQYIDLDGVYVKLYPDTSIVTTATYTFALTDANSRLRASSASYQEFTIPPHSSVAFEIGTVITIYHWGAGAVRINGGVGVTVNSVLDSSTMNSRYQWYQIVQDAEDKWSRLGDFRD